MGETAKNFLPGFSLRGREPERQRYPGLLAPVFGPRQPLARQPCRHAAPCGGLIKLFRDDAAAKPEGIRVALVRCRLVGKDQAD